MPMIRVPVSVSQLADLVDVEPWRLNGVEVDLRNSSVVLVLEPEDRKPQDAHKPWKKAS